MPARDEITRDWLASVLRQDSYEVRPGERDADTLLAKHETRPNITVRLNRSMGVITITHFWRLKKPGWGQDKAILESLNDANRRSWLSTFYRDGDGDLGVSSYIVLTDSVSTSDITGFLDKEANKFQELVVLSDLIKWIQ